MRTLLLITPSKASIPLLIFSTPTSSSRNHQSLSFLYMFSQVLSLSGAPHDNYRARWFELCEDQITGEQVHIYKGGYWEAKELGSWEGTQDIY